MRERKILVPLDESPIAARTVTNLIAHKEKIIFPLTLFHVLDLGRLSARGFPEVTFSQFEKRARQEAEDFLLQQKQRFEEAGIKVETLLKEGPARETICRIADNGDYDLLVVGRNPEGELRSLLFGQVINHVVHQVSCQVLIV